MKQDSNIAVPALVDQFQEEEARDIADAICDNFQDEAGVVRVPLETRWAVERAVLRAFGYVEDDEEDEEDE